MSADTERLVGYIPPEVSGIVSNIMQGLLFVLWAIASAGMAKLLSLAENTIHGAAWERTTLQRVRGIHNVCLFGYPLLLGLLCLRAFATTSSSPAAWSDLPVTLWLLIVPGLIGFGFLVASTIRHWSYRPPACQTKVGSRVVDVSREVAEPLIGSGRGTWLARLPGNEQFQVELFDRQLSLPRWPASWDGVTIVHFSDCHFRGPVARPYFERVMQEVAAMQADLIFFTGDLLDQKACLDWIPSTLGTLRAPLGCYFVLGNHDWYVGIEPKIRAALVDCGWIDASGRTFTLTRGDESIVLAGTEQPWLGTAPDLTATPDGMFRLLLSHSPDQITWARRHDVDLMFAGHTHGGQIRLPVLGPVYSPSIYSCRYASGLFHVAPTLMAVSRGLSGREPIRYLCKPEVSRFRIHRA